MYIYIHLTYINIHFDLYNNSMYIDMYIYIYIFLFQSTAQHGPHIYLRWFSGQAPAQWPPSWALLVLNLTLGPQLPHPPLLQCLQALASWRERAWFLGGIRMDRNNWQLGASLEGDDLWWKRTKKPIRCICSHGGMKERRFWFFLEIMIRSRMIIPMSIVATQLL